MQQVCHSCMEMSERDWGMCSALRAGTQLLDASTGKSRDIAGLLSQKLNVVVRYIFFLNIYSEALQRKPKESPKTLILNGEVKCSSLGH